MLLPLQAATIKVPHKTNIIRPLRRVGTTRVEGTAGILAAAVATRGNPKVDMVAADTSKDQGTAVDISKVLPKNGSSAVVDRTSSSNNTNKLPLRSRALVPAPWRLQLVVA